ncbi:MFS transporter, PPP family, 3-phenylpropionic acid transporter [Rhodospirillales bacterium URHD0017]|nr:MFS transporter, PPP family, 3-phenylpropionic acid transporter [Rhodospirillales bacterium URHD0017]
MRAYVLLYVTLYGAFGVASPYWPKLFESKGLTPQQIGLILAAALLVRLAAGPLLGRLADRLASLRLVLASSIIVAAAAAAAFLWADTFWLVLLIALAQAIALAPTTSLADALTVSATKPRPFEYGRIRGAASAAFLVGTLVIGQLIVPADLTPIIWMNAALLMVAAAATALLPGGTPEPEQRGVATSEVRGLLRLSAFRIVIVVSALVYGSHALYDAFAVIRWSAAGLPPPVISILWAEAVAAEVVVFFVIGPWLLDRLGVRRAAVLAALAGIVRWSAMGFTNSIVLLSVLQPLHGLTFALLHLACMRVIGNVVPPAVAATAQALYAFGAGLVTAALTSLSGTLYATYGGSAFLAMSALCVIALPIAWWGFIDPRPLASSPRSSAGALRG